jgi:hypothetical protein
VRSSAETQPVTLRCEAAGRASKGDGPGRSSFEARRLTRLAPQDDGEVLCTGYASTQSAILVGAGIGKPTCFKPSIWKRIAARISRSVSLTVADIELAIGRLIGPEREQRRVVVGGRFGGCDGGVHGGLQILLSSYLVTLATSKECTAENYPGGGGSSAKSLNANSSSVRKSAINWA